MKKLIATSMLSLATLGFHAAADSFNFQDPKGVNTVRFSLDAPLESISGTTNGVSGMIDFDPAAPEKTSGTLVVDATTLKVPNPVMMDHMHGEGWLNTGKYGEISFKIASVKEVEASDNSVSAHLTGTFSLRGVEKEITVPVTLMHLPGKLADRSNGQMQGDLLVLRSNFTINRSEYGIKPGQNTDKVAEEIEISLALAGYSAKN